MIIYNYSKDWKRLSSCLFILIAAVDIGSACSELARGSVGLLCFHDENMTMQPWIFVTYLSFGLLCYVTSTFFGMVLTVVKTINIINPFYRINGRAWRTCLTLFPLIGFTIFVTDTWLWISKMWLSKPEPCYKGPWTALLQIQNLGEQILLNFAFERLNTIFLVSFQLSLPCLIVLVCMILQIIYIKKALRESADPRQTTANHVTLTIFLISLLYLLSASVYSAFLLFELFFPGRTIIFLLDPHVYVIPVMVAKYTLPLLNAALFPTILILRKPELKARYRGYVGTVLHAPVSIFYYIRNRGRGYTVI